MTVTSSVVTSTDELNKAIEKQQQHIEIEGDLANKTFKIKVTGNVSWLIAAAAILASLSLGDTASLIRDTFGISNNQQIVARQDQNVNDNDNNPNNTDFNSENQNTQKPNTVQKQEKQINQVSAFGEKDDGSKSTNSIKGSGDKSAGSDNNSGKEDVENINKQPEQMNRLALIFAFVALIAALIGMICFVLNRFKDYNIAVSKKDKLVLYKK